MYVLFIYFGLFCTFGALPQDIFFAKLSLLFITFLQFNGRSPSSLCAIFQVEVLFSYESFRK